MGDVSKNTDEEMDKIIEERLNERLKAEREKIEAETEKKYKETIRSSKEQIRSELEKAKEESRKKEEDLANAKKELEELKLSSTASQDEVAKAKAVAEEKEKLLTQAEERAKKLVDGVTAQFNEVLNKKDLEIYKKSRIAEFSGEIIPELVQGATVEEIDEAVEKAKAKYKEIEEMALKKKEEKVLGESKVPGVTSSVGNLNELDYKSMMTMSDAEFDKYSQTLLDEYAKKIGKTP